MPRPLFFIFAACILLLHVASVVAVQVTDDASDTLQTEQTDRIEEEADYPEPLYDNGSIDSEAASEHALEFPADFSFSLLALLRGLLGMVVIIIIAWLFSTDRGAVSWKVVITGLAIQLLLAFGILQVLLPIQNQ